MALPRFHVTERQVLLLLLATTLTTIAAGFLWSSVIKRGSQKLAPGGSARVHWLRPPQPGGQLGAQQLIAEYFDPSLMSLPSTHGFSQAAWRNPAPVRSESYQPVRTPAFLPPPSGREVPVLLEQKALGDLVQAGLEQFAIEIDTLEDSPASEILPPLTNSVIAINGSLGSRRILQQPALPQAPPDLPVRGTRVLIAVNADGRVRYAVLDRSSGNEPLDATAVDLSRQLRFEPQASVDPLALTWGAVRFVWAKALAK